jgi:two-component system OmpR family response regulator
MRAKAGSRGFRARPRPKRRPAARVPALKRILVVEDDPDTQVIVSFALGRGSFVIEVCGTGAEALEKAPAFEPDLVLLDVMLPFMDGPSILREMRRRSSLASVPVIFMTARAQPEDVAEYRSLGSLDVIAKPFDPMTLAENVRAIWSRHHKAVDANDRAALRELQRIYTSQLATRLADIETVVSRIRIDREAADKLFHLAHRLTGSSATLGYSEVSGAARAVEDLLFARDESAGLQDEAIRKIETAVHNLREAAERVRLRRSRRPPKGA